MSLKSGHSKDISRASNLIRTAFLSSVLRCILRTRRDLAFCVVRFSLLPMHAIPTTGIKDSY